ncbi:MAG: peptidoglycan DD-metalloendopeptidase family protein [Burkholderiales bacterium]|nr:peptidoglycan DD-metalloendopeptidase family protein [Burkholderiales bacterium]
MPSLDRGRPDPEASRGRGSGAGPRRRLHPLAALLLLTALSLAPDASAGPRGDLRALRQKVERLTRELAASESSKADATDALRESEHAISQSSRRLFELQSRQEQMRAWLAQLDTEQARLDGAVVQQQAALARSLRHAYLHGPGSSAVLLLAPTDPGQAARRLHYLGHLYRDRAAAIERLRQNQAQVQALAEESRRQEQALAALESEQADARQLLLAQRNERAAALARVSSRIDRQRREIGALRRDEQRLSALVQKLARQLASRAPARKPAAGTGAGKRADGAGKAEQPRRDAGPAALPATGGPVARPVPGELVARFGSPRSGTGLRWNGWFIAASTGTPVKAPAPGRVVFADWLRGFGNLLILDHGEGLMSLYGNNDALLKSVGDEVRGGEQIAAVGSSGGSADSGLYFEVRYQGKPLDPARWIGSR